MAKGEKDLSYSLLLDYYAPVLTQKQREVMVEYYNEDLSLAEIAENHGITRQGVRDAIKHGEAVLTHLEERLGTARKAAAMQADLERMQQLAYQIRCRNSGLYSPDASIDRNTAEMLHILQQMTAQEDADGI